MVQINKPYKEELIERLIYFQDTKLISRAEKYFQNNPNATPQDLRQAGLGRLLAIADERIEILYEYFKVKPKTVKSHKISCKPLSNPYQNKLHQENPEDIDIQLESYEIPVNEQASPKAKRVHYLPQELQTIIGEMHKGTDLSIIAQKVGKKESGLIQKMVKLSKQSPDKFEPEIVKRYRRTYEHTINARKKGKLEAIPEINPYRTNKRTPLLKDQDQKLSQTELELEKVILKIVSSNFNSTNLEPETPLANTIGLDHLDFTELEMLLEEKLGIKIDYSQEASFFHHPASVREYTKYLAQKVARKNRKIKQNQTLSTSQTEI